MDNELGSIETEMKRGFLQLLVLVVLEKDAYGYAMVSAFRDLGYEVEENTLYPLLRRLEKRGLIQGKWELSEERPRKFYAVTRSGREMRDDLLGIWKRQDEIIKRIIKENKHV
jgi:DNA-binding PadR family transcriptional regulator